MRFRALVGHLVGLRRSLGQILVLALAIEVFALVSPFFMQWVIDHALVTADRDLLLTLVLGFALLLAYSHVGIRHARLDADGAGRIVERCRVARICSRI